MSCHYSYLTAELCQCCFTSRMVTKWQVIRDVCPKGLVMPVTASCNYCRWKPTTNHTANSTCLWRPEYFGCVPMILQSTDSTVEYSWILNVELETKVYIFSQKHVTDSGSDLIIVVQPLGDLMQFCVSWMVPIANAVKHAHTNGL